MTESPDVLARHAAAYEQLQARFLDLNKALRKRIRAFDAAVGQILAILGAEAEALAELARRADLSGTPIEELMLAAREYGLLTRAGIHTVEQLAELTETDLCDLRNAGVKSVARIKAQLYAEFGLALKPEAADD
jgi:DNA-directed RNA polymerase alpha subunit